MDPGLIGAIGAVSAPVVGWTLRVLHRIDQRTDETASTVSQHDVTLYGQADVDHDDGIVGDVRSIQEGRAVADGGTTAHGGENA